MLLIWDLITVMTDWVLADLTLVLADLTLVLTDRLCRG